MCLSDAWIELFSIFCWQGKEYVFIANSDNLGAIVDISILAVFLLKISLFVCLGNYCAT